MKPVGGLARESLILAMIGHFERISRELNGEQNVLRIRLCVGALHSATTKMIGEIDAAANRWRIAAIAGWAVAIGASILAAVLL